MTNGPENASLPAQIAEALVGIPKALVPTSIKAIDRLVGAAVDIPVAWLAQKKAQIDAQTQAYTIVEGAIAKVVAEEAGADKVTVHNALSVLVRKSYRKQRNREAVAQAMIEDLRSDPDMNDDLPSPTKTQADLDEDWLNSFERHAEDATTERMQMLWGRVLAGEIRTPGRYSVRTLRYLSELSQAEGLMFAEFGGAAFGTSAPEKAIRPDSSKNIRDLIYLESSGLIQGAAGTLSQTLAFNADGNAYAAEGGLAIAFEGPPNYKTSYTVYAITPLGQELLSLLPGRDLRAAARRFAEGIRNEKIHAAYLLKVINLDEGRVLPMEVLWDDRNQPHPA